MASQTVLSNPSSTPSIDPKNVQGDLIIGLQKRVEGFVFLTIKNDNESKLAFRRLLKSKILPLITSTQDVLDTQKKIDESKSQTKAGDPKKILPITQLNIGFSASGLKKLGVADNELPGETGSPFSGSQKADAVANLGDPVDPKTKKLSTWSHDFLDNEIDAVILITASDDKLLLCKIHEVKEILGSSISHHFVRTGNVRPGTSAGHEHFGYLDGVSVPKIQGFNATQADKQAGIVKPSVILLGQADDPLQSTKQWQKDGSFLAFRQLQQHVPEFQEFCDDTAKKNPLQGVTGDFIGARIVGRWKSGAPLTLAPIRDDPKLIGAQNFDFSDEPEQQRCPYAAHIRKTNPRLTLANPETTVLPHLIVRNGIPYGPELTQDELKEKKTKHDRGLLFVAYQSKIEAGFQLVQKAWSNNPNFPPKPAAKVTAGFDLLIGQSSDSAPRTAQNITSNGIAGDTDPNNVVIAKQLFVLPLGGEYFFSPSIEAIKTKLGA
ncbi:hypothetical protein CROQUDRAFT_67268 [Cronartium quercuum f. sp. fusiforme G11]|uniref:Dyp-type peroxidase n=1 Tax=Cronartium quercuum f. sp. fusiforme G11 TaxID=708437 RepID=A0A9P6NDT5_9BASI|nr:hypothetical protein CROQUDRAFT_67268 [Cronartium quercuum f. sp. fusiforme G11]